MPDRNAELWAKARDLGLPPLSYSHEEAASHLRTHGLALLGDALTPAEVRELSDRLLDQAEAERRAGTAVLEGLGRGSAAAYGKAGPNQRVWGLVNKGEAFRRLVLDARVLRLIGEAFRADYQGPDVPAETDEVLLSSSTANIVGSGGQPMSLHLDQRNAPFKTPYPITFNAICMLTDFLPGNGATLVAPGSHLAVDPELAYGSRVIPAAAPAGTIMILDGRLLHGTGASHCDAKRVAILNYYCRPFVRPQENYCLSLRPEVYAACGDKLRALLGFKAWNTFGGVDGHHHGLLPSLERTATGEMSVLGA